MEFVTRDGFLIFIFEFLNTTLDYYWERPHHTMGSFFCPICSGFWK